MNVFNKNMRKNPLKVTLLFSLLLHAAGFYFMSNISFNSKTKSTDTAPIKITALIEKQEVLTASIKQATQRNSVQTNHSPQLVSTDFKDIYPKKPAPMYKNNYQLKLVQSHLDSLSPKTINKIYVASNHKSLPLTIKYQKSFRKNILIVSPRLFETSQSLQKNISYSPKPIKRINTSEKFILSKVSRKTTNSKTQTDNSLGFKPISLFSKSAKEQRNRVIPHVRKAAHTNSFSDKSLDQPQTTTMAKITPATRNSSHINIGELRRGFHEKIWQKVAKAKYYPRIARKRGFEGEPIVRFTLDKDGSLTSIKLIKDSKYEILNNAALETIRRGTPYPPIPKPLGKFSISFNLPISYMLEE
jgi:TonB family protein